MMTPLVLMALLAAPRPNHAYFVAHVQAAARRMGVTDTITVEPSIGEIRLTLVGFKKPQQRRAYVQPVGRDFVVIYDPSWLAKTREREARWVAYHEVAHVAFDAPLLRRGVVTKAESREMEARANDAADQWIAVLDKEARKGGKRKWLAIGAAILFLRGDSSWCSHCT